MLRTGKEYLESVRDGRRVPCGGEWIDDITTHPEAGARHEIFERFNGTPVFLIKLLTMQRVEYANILWRQFRYESK